MARSFTSTTSLPEILWCDDLALPTTAYSGSYSSGNRTSLITATQNSTPGNGTIAELINGISGTSAGIWWSTANTSGLEIKFDFGSSPQFITEVTIALQSGFTWGGTWEWLVSHDDVTYYVVMPTTSFSTATTQICTLAPFDPSGYRYYKLKNITLATSNPWVEEMTFKTASGNPLAYTPTTGLTMSCWVYPTLFHDASGANIGCPMTLASDNINEFFDFQFQLADTTGVFQASANTAASFAAAGATAVSLNAWTHLCGTLSSATVQSFVNGANKATTTDTPGSQTGFRYVSLGGLRTSGSGSWKCFFQGYVAECAIWNTVLSDTDIASLGFGLTAPQVRPDRLVRYWPMFGTSTGGAEQELCVSNTFDNVRNAPPIAPTNPPLIYPKGAYTKRMKGS